MRSACALVFGVLASTGASDAGAHDYWIEPGTFRPTVGQSVSMRLLVGEHLREEEERTFERAKFSAIDLWSPSGKRTLLGELAEGTKPFARLSFDRPGTYLLTTERPPQTITLDAAKFEAYLREEGLESIVLQRAARGESASPGRERYTRYLKAWMRASGSPSDLHARPIGQRLEILVDTDPTTFGWGSALSVRVLFEGKPLPAARVEFLVRDGPTVAIQSQMTSTAGAATFLAFPGTAIVRLVHMRRCSGCTDADWESFWASYALGIAP